MTDKRLPVPAASADAVFPAMPVASSSGTDWFSRRALARENRALELARDRQLLIRSHLDAYAATADAMRRTAEAVARLNDLDAIRDEARAEAAHEREIARRRRVETLEALDHAAEERAEQRRARLLDLERATHNAQLGLDVLRAARELTMRVAAMRKEADVADVEQTLGFLRRQTAAPAASSSARDMLVELARQAGQDRDRHFAAGDMEAGQKAAERFALIQQLIVRLDAS